MFMYMRKPRDDDIGCHPGGSSARMTSERSTGRIAQARRSGSDPGRGILPVRRVHRADLRRCAERHRAPPQPHARNREPPAINQCIDPSALHGAVPFGRRPFSRPPFGRLNRIVYVRLVDSVYVHLVDRPMKRFTWDLKEARLKTSATKEAEHLCGRLK